MTDRTRQQARPAVPTAGCGPGHAATLRPGSRRAFQVALAVTVGLSLLPGHPLPAFGASAADSQTPRYSRVIEPVSPGPLDGQWIQFSLDPAVLDHASAELSDLRIVDASGALLPHRLRSQDPMETRWSTIRSARLEWKPNPGGGWFAELEIEGLPDRAIVVMGEADIRLESVGDEGRSFYAEQRPVDPNHSAFVLPGGDSHWKLFTSRSSSSPDPGADFYEEVRKPRTLEEVEFTLETSRSGSRNWVGRLRLAGAPRPVAAIEAQCERGVPDRVEVAIALNGRNWLPMSVGLTLPEYDATRNQKSDTAPGGSGDASDDTEGTGNLRIEWPPTERTDRIRLTVHDASGPGAPIEVLRVLAIPDEIEFRATGTPPFRLLYGDPHLGPRDVVLTTPEFLVRSRLPARLGAELANPFAEAPRGMEWLRRHPVVLSTALFAVLALLAVLALAGRSRQVVMPEPETPKEDTNR